MNFKKWQLQKKKNMHEIITNHTQNIENKKFKTEKIITMNIKKNKMPMNANAIAQIHNIENTKLPTQKHIKKGVNQNKINNVFCLFLQSYYFILKI